MQGKPAEAQRLLTDLLERPEPNRLLVLPHLAWSHVELGEVRRGLELAQEAERETRERGALLSLPEILRIQGMALSRLGRIMEAESVLTEGRERARAMPLPYTEARILVELALLDRQEGREDRARERLEDALAIVCRLGAAKDAERTEELLAALSCDAPAPSSQNSAGTVSQNWEAPISQYSPAAPSQKSESAMIRLTDAQWGRIAELLPPRRAGRGRPRADDRQTLEAILYIQRTGCAWADLPPELGNHATAHRRWQEWRADGLWDQIVALADRPLPSTAKEQHAGKDAVAPIEQSGGVGHSSLGPQTPHRSDARPSRDL
jgi:hypothetical protein